MFYFDVLSAFYDHHVAYLVVGGMAVNLYGVPRVTNDLDVIISFEKSNVQKVSEAMKLLGYVPRLPGVSAEDLSNEVKLSDWIQNRNLKSFSYYQPSSEYRHVDILLVHPLNFEEAFKRKTVSSIKEIKFNLISLQDLIDMKEYSGRPQDLSDVEHLNTIRNTESDEKK